ncbi:hypothetical protein ACSDR0_48910 [Streptosporangium sp. G11]|uniref:hypothetical protein n=1 Tax=Streptosporangium sp. G11 TaxID=3436926 RepID=UPI003EBD741A
MPSQSKTELYAAIRRDVRSGMSIRAVMRKHSVSYLTVTKASASAWPEPRKKPTPRPTRLDPYKPLIDAMLLADLDAPRKQRHTTTRIFDRLVGEHGAMDLSYGIVRRYVAERRPQIRVEAGRGPVEAFIPQSHRPGAEAEVDFGDVTVRLAGEQVTCYLFSLRLSYSGKAVHRPIDRTNGPIFADRRQGKALVRQASFSLFSRTEPRWGRARRLVSGMSRGCWWPASERFGPPMTRRFHGLYWAGPGSRLRRSPTS